MKEKKIFAICVTVTGYHDARQKFFKDNQNIKVLEEIKTLLFDNVQTPHPVLLGQTISKRELMVAWYILYEVEIKNTVN